MKTTILLISLLYFSFSVYTQTSFKFTGDYLYINPINELFVKNKNILYKINNKGEILYTYNSPIGTDIEHVDIYNPMQILVFSKNFNKVIVLNNKLSELSKPISLDNFNHSNVSIICSSASGGFWIFDNNLRKFIHYNNQMQQNIVSNDIYSMPFYKNDFPTNLVENANNLIAFFPNSGIMIFNRNGNFIKHINAINVIFAGSFGENISYFEDGVIKRINLNNNTQNEFNIDLNNDVKNIYLMGNSLYIYDGKEVVITNIK